MSSIIKVDNIQDFNWDQDSFAKQLQASGYQTALIGKIHLRGLPQGFDYSAVLPGQGHYYNPDFIVNGVMERIQGYVTTITTNLSLDWLKNKREKNKPFLLLYHQKAPHRNWHSCRPSSSPRWSRASSRSRTEGRAPVIHTTC